MVFCLDDIHSDSYCYFMGFFGNFVLEEFGFSRKVNEMIPSDVTRNRNDKVRRQHHDWGGMIVAKKKSQLTKTRKTEKIDIFRRFQVGDVVLVKGMRGVRNPVNAHGFPKKRKSILLSGPLRRNSKEPVLYEYTLCKVVSVHFAEHIPFYTVMRYDNAMKERADIVSMLPVAGQGKDAAYKASIGDEPFTSVCQQIGADLSFESEVHKIDQFSKSKHYLTNFIDGISPFLCSIHLSYTKIMSIFSLWFVFSDLIRIAAFPPAADFGFMVVSFIVWFFLVCELVAEYIVRPTSYEILMKQSSRAYDPSLGRYLSTVGIIIQSIALIFYIPEFICLFFNEQDACIMNRFISFEKAVIMIDQGPTRKNILLGYLYLFPHWLRLHSLVRRWIKMLIRSRFVEKKDDPAKLTRNSITRFSEDAVRADKLSFGDEHYKNASHVGTALLILNSSRACLIIILVFNLLPLLFSLLMGMNTSWKSLIEMLQAGNVAIKDGSQESCTYLGIVIRNAFSASSLLHAFNQGVHMHRNVQDSAPEILWLQILPPRCRFQGLDGVVTAEMCALCNNSTYADISCGIFTDDRILNNCFSWIHGTSNSTIIDVAKSSGIRSSSVRKYSIIENELVNDEENEFSVTVMANMRFTIIHAAVSQVFLFGSCLLLILISIWVLERDQNKLVVNPVRRMLWVAQHYATNPFHKREFDVGSFLSDTESTIGILETKSLVCAFAKITELMKKYWGVAGADIISSSFDKSKESFSIDPFRTGKCIYAIFAFSSICSFNIIAKNLDEDVILLINNVASVLHREIFRWGWYHSGEVNRNLGGSFLMIFRIGSRKAVTKRLQQATNVMFRTCDSYECDLDHCDRCSFNSNSYSHNYDDFVVSLASLPGVESFTDRSLVGLLKTYAGLHRDKCVTRWQRDYRLSSLDKNSAIDMVFGLDAGWAIEGALGDMNKLDATYLSPHVNMSSRMMTACNLYGLNFLLSESFVSLLSPLCKSKLRHIDRVVVKGASIPQNIYTYDARNIGVNFFLHEQTEEMSDFQAHSFSFHAWEDNMDLLICRSHISSEFETIFSSGISAYLSGNWGDALVLLNDANNLMIQQFVENGYFQGFIEDSFPELASVETDVILKKILHNDLNDSRLTYLKNCIGDGPCRYIIQFMKSYGNVAPKSWRGFRSLVDK